jgi:hypothetical protein
MASNLGFDSTTSVEHRGMPRKKTVSRGLIVAFILLVLILLAFAGLKMFHNSLVKQKDAITVQISDEKKKLENSMTPEDADFVVRSQILEDELYRGYDSNAVLGEIENIMVLKESDNSGHRTVLKSFQYNSGSKTKKTFDDGEATLTGSGSITITADADTFDVMAQQIEAFKTSEYFDNIQVGTTDRDDMGRIIFTLTMDVVGSGASPYEDSSTPINVNTEPVVMTPVTEVEVGDVEMNTSGDTEGADIIINTENNIEGDITAGAPIE